MTESGAYVAHVATAFFTERLAPYLRAMKGDLAETVRLYEYAFAVSGAFYEALGILEVVLRNALSEQLTAHHGTLADHWHDDPLDVLSVQAIDDIAAARHRVAKLRPGESSGRVIAELNFDFWKFLLVR